MKSGRGHDRGRTPNRVSFTPGREGERSHSPIVTPAQIGGQREVEETAVLKAARLEALRQASEDDNESSSKGGSEDGSSRGRRPRRANAGKKPVWRQLSNGDYGTHTPGKPAAGRGGGRGKRK
ncbi:MAG: hypothetical protein L7U87_04750 [Chlamydiales bacterium]|nr:hypothetical protein [Chlamydiales bacterium]